LEAGRLFFSFFSFANPYVLLAAIISLGFLVIHTLSMIIAFNGYGERKKSDQIFVPVVHLVAAVMVSAWWS
jgi:hypothetical protein